jgi:hypothetical protein
LLKLSLGNRIVAYVGPAAYGHRVAGFALSQTEYTDDLLQAAEVHVGDQVKDPHASPLSCAVQFETMKPCPQPKEIGSDGMSHQSARGKEVGDIIGYKYLILAGAPGGI